MIRLWYRNTFKTQKVKHSDTKVVSHCSISVFPNLLQLAEPLEWFLDVNLKVLNSNIHVIFRKPSKELAKPLGTAEPRLKNTAVVASFKRQKNTPQIQPTFKLSSQELKTIEKISSLTRPFSAAGTHPCLTLTQKKSSFFYPHHRMIFFATNWWWSVLPSNGGGHPPGPATPYRFNNHNKWVDLCIWIIITKLKFFSPPKLRSGRK